MTIIPFIPSLMSSDKKDKVGFYVKTNPDDEASDQVKVYVAPFENGGPEDLLQFVSEFFALMQMKCLTENGPTLFQHARLLVTGDALEKFKEKIEDLLGVEGVPQAETPENFQAALDLLLWAILSVKAGEKIKRKLCKTKKPMSMDVTTFVARLKKIN